MVSLPLSHLENRMRNIFLLVVMLCSLPRLAAPADMDCTLLEKKRWEQVYPDAQFDPTACKCKRIPDDTTQAIVVAGTWLAIGDVSTGEVLSDGGEINMDATGFSIDTARYWVAPGVRAFGIRGGVAPYHQYSEQSVDQLNLYVRKGERIVPILEKLITQDADDGVTVNGCTDPNTCTGKMSDFKRSIEVMKTATNGYFDFAVVETSRHCEGAETREACKKSETWRHELKRTYTLRYDGTTYGITTALPPRVMLFEQ